jgi:hypothetical protein
LQTTALGPCLAVVDERLRDDNSSVSLLSNFWPYNMDILTPSDQGNAVLEEHGLQCRRHHKISLACDGEL